MNCRSHLPTSTASSSRDHLGAPRTLDGYLVDEHVDALLLWHDGRLRQEIYRNGQTRRDRHIVFSVTKSFTGLLAEMLIEDGLLDDRRLVSEYIAELGHGAYADATLRHVLDMEVGIDFDEVYDDPDAEIARFAYAAGMRAIPEGVDRETDPVRVPADAAQAG